MTSPSVTPLFERPGEREPDRVEERLAAAERQLAEQAAAKLVSFGDPQTRAMQLRIDELERLVRRLVNDRHVGSVVDGSFVLSWKTRIKSPEGVAYVLRRASGGALTLVAAAAAVDSDWSDS